MQGLLHCDRLPGLDFWGIILVKKKKKTALTQSKMAIAEKKTCSEDCQQGLHKMPMQGLLHYVCPPGLPFLVAEGDRGKNVGNPIKGSHLGWDAPFSMRVYEICL